MNTPNALQRIKNIRSVLYYAIWDYAGAVKWPFLCKEAADQIEIVAKLVSDMTEGHGELLIWDAYRSEETQAFIFNKYMNELRLTHGGLSQEELFELTKKFVTSPNTPFPHGLGGAVDVTLWIDGKMADMGTGFDEFIPKAAKNWFQQTPPVTPEEKNQHANREIMFKALTSAGWVGIASEWWHWEYGTPRWAAATCNPALYEKILPVPSFDDAASARDFVPSRQPRFQTGVAQVFTDQDARARSLAHKSGGHYYMRNSHPTTASLCSVLERMYDAQHVHLTCSGLNALTTVAKAIVPCHGTILCHKKVYYECQGSLSEERKIRGWNIKMVDFSDAATVEQYLDAGVNLLLLDNPSNWFLDTFDVKNIAAVAARYGVPCVADISVQPIQRILQKGVSIAVVSLSKYPSLGLEPGGAILTNESSMMDKISKIISNEGLVLAPAAAERILEHLPGLNDRMAILSQKTTCVGNMLQKNALVRSVCVANPKLCNGLTGGQLSFRLNNPEQGIKIEKVIGHNALRDKTALHLACTFGAFMTTFEHFASNQRYRNTWTKEETNEWSFPADMCRLGIGLEPLEDILDDLRFVLESTN